MNKNIFREYDIRGVYGKDLDRKVSFIIGKSFGKLLKQKNLVKHRKIAVGKDIRNHSQDLFEGLVRGILSENLNIMDLGVCPTPVFYFSLHYFELDGGIMITGSHNPPEYNGYKICIGKETIFGEEIQKLYEIGKSIENSKEEINIVGSIEKIDINKIYMDYLKKRFKNLEGDGIRVAVDSGNGCAGFVVPNLLKELGFNVIELFSEPDGRFPNHHPDPTKIETLKTLRETVVKNKIHVGFAYDGDVDRIGVVDEKGTIIPGDIIGLILAEDIISKYPKGVKVIGEVKNSDVFFTHIRKIGGIPIMWKTGHSLIKKKMKEENAILAAEMSGHIFIRDDYFGFDDAIYTTLRFLKIVKDLIKKGEKLSKRVSKFLKNYSTPEIRIELPKEDIKLEIVERFKRQFEELFGNEVVEKIMIDGVRLSLKNGWILLRSSNTQPVLVLRGEAESKEKLDYYMNKLKTWVFKEIESYIN